MIPEFSSAGLGTGLTWICSDAGTISFRPAHQKAACLNVAHMEGAEGIEDATSQPQSGAGVRGLARPC